jgi:hypothetical protein
MPWDAVRGGYVTPQRCRVIFNKLENCASSWFYYRNISRCMVTWTSKVIVKLVMFVFLRPNPHSVAHSAVLIFSLLSVPMISPDQQNRTHVHLYSPSRLSHSIRRFTGHEAANWVVVNKCGVQYCVERVKCSVMAESSDLETARD